MKSSKKSSPKTVVKVKESYPSRYKKNEEKLVVKEKPKFPSRYK
jgi:hypothetical protein